MSRKSRRDDLDARLPIKLDSTSNGEFEPVPLGAAARFANRLAHERTGEAARRLGWSRRRFLTSACGAAATLLAMDEAFARAGLRGGRFAVPADAAFEPELADVAVGGDEFVFDVQGHHVSPGGGWRRVAPRWERVLEGFPYADCAPEDDDPVACFSADRFVREVFVESDTDLAVLSFVPEPDLDAAPLRIEEAAATRAVVDAMQGSRRLLLHGPVHPNFPGELERMDELAERWGVVAWKTYTQYGPGGRGYALDDEEVGIPFIEKARVLGVRVICVHKGLPLAGMDLEHSTCRDVGVVARRYPDVDFIVYHSGYETRTRERAYAPEAARRGIDSLVTAVRENGIPPDGNVYAELGSTWRFLMRDPGQAAHALGKLLRYVGEDRVLWGTDSIWYGSPQDQIQAFRSFQIDESLRERHGYPELTPAIRAKVLGLNAAGPYRIAPDEIRRAVGDDGIDRAKRAFRHRPDPSFRTWGPRTRREFLQRVRQGGI